MSECKGHPLLNDLSQLLMCQECHQLKLTGRLTFAGNRVMLETDDRTFYVLDDAFSRDLKGKKVVVSVEVIDEPKAETPKPTPPANVVPK